MDSERKVNQVFNDNSEGRRLKGRPKTDCGTMYRQTDRQTDINKCKITNWNERSKNRAEWEKLNKEEKVRIGI